MRKHIIDPASRTGTAPTSKQQWLKLEDTALVEVSSEHPSHPIESALIPGAGAGWRAEQPGQQTVRLLFDVPQKVRHVRVVFQEQERQRTQEFVLRWSSDGGQSSHEMVRQQYNFSPPATVDECEDYAVQLDGVTALELTIVPDINGGPACASLAELRVA